jgi:ferredoxin-NADP reductase
MAHNSFDVVVNDVVEEAVGIVSLSLRATNGEPLPPWEPGAHIDLVLTDELVRQYSLCGDPNDSLHYKISVLAQTPSRGGSQYVHAAVRPGQALRIRGPRNHFQLVKADSYLFIAGGIGITPILPMIAAVASRGARFRLLYGGRARLAMAFTDQLMEYGSCVEVVPQDECGLLDVEAAISGLSPGAKIYCCGPESLISAVERLCEERDPYALHVERFAASNPDLRADEHGSSATEPVSVTLQRSGVALELQPGCSLLDAILDAGVHIDWDCREGLCGSCEVKILSGNVDHRDDVLTKWEKENNSSMMTCCSRPLGDLVLDL